MSHFTVYESPIGPLTLTGEAGALTGVWFRGQAPAPTEDAQDRSALAEPIAQLDQYFAGDRRTFALALKPRGTPFQRRVWRELETIPYGTTISYGELAKRLERERGEWVSPRAVGAANGANPIAIIVPCHRVIGADGSLTGYGGGLHRKQALLALEGGEPPASMWAERQVALDFSRPFTSGPTGV